MSQPPTVSICFGTLQRRPFLELALFSARRAVGKLSHEFVIADGGSTDGTLEYLREFAMDPKTKGSVMVIPQGERLGAVKAFNAAFHAARGEFVAAFNDDAVAIGTPFAGAVRMLRADKTIGQIAIPFLTYPIGDVAEIPEHMSGTPETQNVSLPGIGLVTYANFSVMRRSLGDSLGWWGDGIYWQYAGDTELSAQVWAHGLRVVALDVKDGYLIHYQAQDDTRVPNVEQAPFNARWGNHPKVAVASRDHESAVSSSVIPQKLLAAEATPDIPRLMRGAVLLRFKGGQDGKHPYTPPNSSFKYLVSAREPLVWVDGKDAAWMLSLHQGRGPSFERV